MEATATSTNGRGYFLAKRLMSFLGVFPLGIYLILHFWTNLSSIGGAQAYDKALSDRHHPFFYVLEILLGIAFLLHIVIGIWIITKWRPNNLRSKTFSNLKFALQRLSGMGLMIFLVAHVYKARISPLFNSPLGRESFESMRHHLSEPLTFAVYILGVVGASYHLANGLWTFLMTWGITIRPRSQRIAQVISFALFAGLLLMAGLSLYGFLR